MRHTPGYYGCYNSSVYTGYGASLFQPKYSEHQKSKTKPISGKQPLNSTAKTYFCFVTFVFLLYIALIGWHNIVLVEQPITEKH